MKIIVFINRPQLEDISQHESLKTLFELSEKNFLLGFVETGNNFSPEYIGHNIILVRDDLNETHPSLKKLISELEGQEVCILHHRSPSVQIIEKFTPLQSRKGMHSNDAKSLYKELFEILFSDSPLKMQTLLQELFPGAGSIRSKEKILLLLHDCLHPSSAAQTDTSWLSPPQKALVQSIALEKDNFGQAYITKLTQLRESMLETI